MSLVGQWRGGGGEVLSSQVKALMSLWSKVGEKVVCSVSYGKTKRKAAPFSGQ